MAWLSFAAGVVATIQGVAWLAAGAGPRRVLGATVAALGLVALLAGLVHVLVPSFLAR